MSGVLFDFLAHPIGSPDMSVGPMEFGCNSHSPADMSGFKNYGRVGGLVIGIGTWTISNGHLRLKLQLRGLSYNLL